MKNNENHITALVTNERLFDEIGRRFQLKPRNEVFHFSHNKWKPSNETNFANREIDIVTFYQAPLMVYLC